MMSFTMKGVKQHMIKDHATPNIQLGGVQGALSSAKYHIELAPALVYRLAMNNPKKFNTKNKIFVFSKTLVFSGLAQPNLFINKKARFLNLIEDIFLYEQNRQVTFDILSMRLAYNSFYYFHFIPQPIAIVFVLETDFPAKSSSTALPT